MAGPIPGLHAVGSPRKGVLYESTAIPEIRAQAAEVARTLLARRRRVSVRTGEAGIGPAIS